MRGYRNGYEDKQIQAAEGPLHLKMPQVRNTTDSFESVWPQVLVDASASWRGVKVTPASAQQLEVLRPRPSTKALPRLAA